MLRLSPAVFRTVLPTAFLLTAALAFPMGLPLPLAAQESDEAPPEFRLGLSWFDLEGEQASPGLEFSLRPGGALPLGIRPQLGAMGNGDGGFYVYGGLTREFELGAGFRVSPSLSAGLYQQGESLDLGSPLEFRSGLLLDRAVWRDHRLGVFLYHLSNAGLAQRNPGVEVLGLAYGLRW
ncbi:MAG: acyloxyacyl hydrolase [Gemmatimonadales bacterium]|nr:MAG: acyloxyacyl hydrolase [Gemmatimonadales bacterium]